MSARPSVTFASARPAVTPSKLAVASTYRSPSSGASTAASTRTAFSAICGVSFSDAIRLSGAYSSHTVFQMPVVCTYQQAKFSGSQRCLPRGWLRLRLSETCTASRFSPVRTRLVMSNEKRA